MTISARLDGAEWPHAADGREVRALKKNLEYRDRQKCE
jgi:hypothetical protein